MVLGFVGVLIIVKPSQFNWAAVMALIVAVSMALNNLLIKKLPTHHSVFQTLFLTSLMGIPSSLLLALGEGSEWDFSSLWLAAVSNIFILCYAGICVWVYRAINPSKVAGAEYTGLLGAIIVGSLWFNETPEMSMYYGAALIILPLIWVARADRKTSKLATKLKETT
ncbi:DMT family transporter [Psychrobium sp. nBUS_13]|uniref:DMT family transporter n=1 Tax=Psychrobium sp. nBUS_13 TaxID=3395319 RepID=UPI003EB8DD20